MEIVRYAGPLNPGSVSGNRLTSSGEGDLDNETSFLSNVVSNADAGQLRERVVETCGLSFMASRPRPSHHGRQSQ
jgi:hypothetical protein